MQLLEASKQNYRYERRLERICYIGPGINLTSLYIDPIKTKSVLFVEHTTVICAPSGRKYWVERECKKVEKTVGIPNKLNVTDCVTREANVIWRCL